MSNFNNYVSQNLVQNKKELVGKVMEAIASMKITGS